MVSRMITLHKLCLHYFNAFVIALQIYDNSSSMNEGKKKLQTLCGSAAEYLCAANKRRSTKRRMERSKGAFFTLNYISLLTLPENPLGSSKVFHFFAALLLLLLLPLLRSGETRVRRNRLSLN